MITSVRELKNRLSEALRRVADGEEVLVTSRRKRVARIVPVMAGGDDDRLDMAAVLQELRRLRAHIAPRVRGEAASATVVRMRREARR